MDYETERDAELQGNFRLLCSLIQQGRSAELAVDLKPLEKLIQEEIPAAMGKNAPPDYYELYVDFKAEYEKFRDYILYDKLIGKNVAALGGGFSSGKSTFLNALNGEDALPVSIDPSTAVPTYVVQAPDYNVQAINIFDTKVTFEELLDIQKIAHGFGAAPGADGEAARGVTLGHVLESLFLETPLQRYENLAFLDTPGYSKPDSRLYSSKTDEQIARQQLNTANVIFWFVSAQSGTIPESDIRFLRSLREGIPKAVVLTRAAEKEDALEEIRKKVSETLTLKGIACEGVWAYERDDPEGYDMPEIRAFLSRWNRKAAAPDFAINFKRLFVRCRKFYEDEKEKKGGQLEQLNRAEMLLPAEDGEVSALLHRLSDTLRREMQALKTAEEQVHGLQDAFFQEIHRVGELVGIRMPEPSEVDLLQENANDPLQLLQAYNKAHNIRANRRNREILREAFERIVAPDGKTAFCAAAGGGQYAKKLAGLLRENLRVEDGETHLNDVCRRSERYAALIQAAQR